MFTFIFRLSKREKYIAYIAFALVAYVLFDRVVLRPVMVRQENLNKEIQEQEQKLEKSIRILKQEDLIKSEYKKYAQNLKQNVSDEEAIPAILSSVEKTANATSVTIVDMKPFSAENLEFYKRIKIKIEAEAKIEQLADFIYQLEISPKLLRVTQISLTPKKQGSSILKVNVTVTGILIV